MLFGGIIVGLLYDLYRKLWLRKYLRSWKKHAGDLLFSLFVSIFLIALFFYSNWGELRSYIFLGVVIGIFLYFKIKKVLKKYLL